MSDGGAHCKVMDVAVPETLVGGLGYDGAIQAYAIRALLSADSPLKLTTEISNWYYSPVVRLVTR